MFFLVAILFTLCLLFLVEWRAAERKNKILEKLHKIQQVTIENRDKQISVLHELQDNLRSNLNQMVVGNSRLIVLKNEWIKLAQETLTMLRILGFWHDELEALASKNEALIEKAQGQEE
jgi:hypothetical protein